jgi:hypothetical protein
MRSKCHAIDRNDCRARASNRNVQRPLTAADRNVVLWKWGCGCAA